MGNVIITVGRAIAKCSRLVFSAEIRRLRAERRRIIRHNEALVFGIVKLRMENEELSSQLDHILFCLKPRPLQSKTLDAVRKVLDQAEIEREEKGE